MLTAYRSHHHFLVCQNFVSDSEFCFRTCKDGPGAPALCQHIYDLMGRDWNMPGKYDQDFAQCTGDSGEVCLKLKKHAQLST